MAFYGANRLTELRRNLQLFFACVIENNDDVLPFGGHFAVVIVNEIMKLQARVLYPVNPHPHAQFARISQRLPELAGAGGHHETG